jgi:hypothetical protein
LPAFRCLRYPAAGPRTFFPSDARGLKTGLSTVIRIQWHPSQRSVAWGSLVSKRMYRPHLIDVKSNEQFRV